MSSHFIRADSLQGEWPEKADISQERESEGGIWARPRIKKDFDWTTHTFCQVQPKHKDSIFITNHDVPRRKGKTNWNRIKMKYRYYCRDAN